MKICGMREPDNIQQVSLIQPDYLGLIFYEGSPRFVSKSIGKTRKEIKKVGVFVNASEDDILEKVEKFDLSAVQLHGGESADFCSRLKKTFSEAEILPQIIKVFSIKEEFDFEVLKSYENHVDLFLFDTKGQEYGGNGIAFNWEVLKNYPSTTPFFLSGGIGPEEVPGIRELYEHFLKKGKQKIFYGVDVNSKFETAPGLKNADKLRNFKEELYSEDKNKTMDYQVNEKGYYGDFGGAFIPEMLYPNVEELRKNYLNIMQEESFQEEFRKLLKDYVGRPTPLYYAERFSKKYSTNIYLKREDLCHTGAHKVNNTIGQILMAKRLGKNRIIAETGAGQHGVATATVCALMGLDCFVYMGEIDMQRQAPNVARMKMLGATVIPARSGSKTLKDATNEAIRDWINNPVDTHYIIGSVVGPHPYPDMVARFQSVISEEVKKQLLEKEGREDPDHLVACVGGGSNAAGLYYHYLNNENVNIIAVEAAGEGVLSGKSAATSALGKEGIIHGSKTLLMQTEDGQITEPYSISAGLDYPGVGPMHANLFKTGRGEFISVTDTEAMEAGIILSKLEGIIPAIETAHALAIFESRKFQKDEVIVVNLSGRGDKDLNTYIEHFNL
jgi:phosphoribosylanthranilate isomerase